jgi:predicted GNAT family acetyltransferase
MAVEVRDNPARTRYELFVDDHLVGFTEYHPRDDGAYLLPHTVITERERGAGHGGALVQAALDDARRRGWRIVPQCPFVARFIEEHPDYADLVA